MTADTVGGVWTYSLELARALGQAGVEVALATMGAPLTADQRREAARLKRLEIYESDYRLEWMDEPWRDVWQAGEWLLALEAKLRPDVIHLNGYVHGALPWKAPVVVVGHSCVLSWWRAVKGEAAPASWNRYRREVTRGLRGADVVVAPTAEMLEELKRYYGPFPESMVIANGRSPELFAPAAKRRPYICTAGRLWDEAKNVAMLQRVAPALSWPVMVAGESRHPEGGEAELTPNVHYLGRLSPNKLAERFASASIYALPARYEPFGLSVVEAALAGCALVLGDIATLREVWRDSALFVSPDDPEALEQALKQLIADEPKRKLLSERARSLALNYTPGSMAAGYLGLYSSLLARRSMVRPAGARAVLPAVTLRQP